MQLTLRLQHDNYLDVMIDVGKRTITFLSPIPDLTQEQIMELCDKFHIKLILPISGEEVVPDVLKLSNEDIVRYYTQNTYDILHLLFSLVNCSISGD